MPDSWLNQVLAQYEPLSPEQATAIEGAAADQNQFDRDMRQGALDVSRGTLGVNRTNAQTSRYSAETGRMSAKADAAYKEGLIEQARKELEFKYHQQAQNYEIQLGQLGVQRGQLGLGTLELGASLKGPRNWDTYLETAAAAGRNPLLQDAIGNWASLVYSRPNTGAVSGGPPQRFDLNALVSDFTGQGVAGQGPLPRNNALDQVASMPGHAPPGWWQRLSRDEQERARGYWETRGYSPDTILDSLSYTAASQGTSYGPSNY